MYLRRRELKKENRKSFLLKMSTLVYLINMQDVIIMQAGKFPKIIKHVGFTKAMQVGIFQKSIVKYSIWVENIPKFKNVQDVIRTCWLECCKKSKRMCCTFIRYSRVLDCYKKNIYILLGMILIPCKNLNWCEAKFDTAIRKSSQDLENLKEHITNLQGQLNISCLCISRIEAKPKIFQNILFYLHRTKSKC